VVVAVKLRPLIETELSPKLRHLLDQKLYLPWTPDNSDAQELFWLKLQDAILPPGTTPASRRASSESSF
jgi:hypothetical protein